MLDCNLFIERYYPNANESKISDLKRFINHFEKIIGKKTPQEILSDVETVCRLFYLQDAGAIGRTHYQKIKDYVINLFDWFGVQGEVPSREKVLKSSESTCFFQNLKVALNFIDEVGKRKIVDYSPYTDLVTIKTIFVLGWYGLSRTEIVNLKKSDVSEKNGKGYITLSDRTIEIDKTYFESIISLKYLDGYKSLPEGRYREFKSDEAYMFRLTKVYHSETDEDNGQFKETHLVDMLKRFNSQVPFDLNYRIVFRYIHVNALFTVIYKDKSDKSLSKKIIEITHCSEKQAASYKTQYLAWVETLKKI